MHLHAYDSFLSNSIFINDILSDIHLISFILFLKFYYLINHSFFNSNYSQYNIKTVFSVCNNNFSPNILISKNPEILRFELMKASSSSVTFSASFSNVTFKVLIFMTSLFLFFLLSFSTLICSLITLFGRIVVFAVNSHSLLRIYTSKIRMVKPSEEDRRYI